MAKGAKTGGRQKGSPNKITADLKAMILGALSDAGGQKYLAKQAEESPAAFLSLLGKVLPTTLQGPGDTPLLPPTIVVQFGNDPPTDTGDIPAET